MAEQTKQEAESPASAKGIFAVIRRFSPAYDQEKALEAQPDWEAHRAFMNAIKAEGLVRLGGPLVDTSEVLLVLRGASKEQIARRLEEDPWTRSGFLLNDRILRWNLRMGAIP